MTKGRLILLGLLATLLFINPTYGADTTEKTFNKQCKTERISFLKSTPEGLQQKQKEAILKAINGDNTSLQEVRNSRNIKAEVSENVIVENISETMRLYRPKTSDTALPILIYLHGGGWTIGSINSCSE